MKFKKFRRIGVVLSVSMMVLSVSSISYASEVGLDKNQPVTRIVENKIAERTSIGFEEFLNLQPGKQYSLLDQKGEEKIFLVELTNSLNELSGYMVVDLNKEKVVEFAIGNTHPLIKEQKNKVRYLGPASYAEEIGNGFVKDMRTQTIHNISDIKQKTKVVDKQQISAQNTKSLSSTPIITDYDYDVISNVPDYIQNDNTDMENDCVPTSAANVLMYWDYNGYSNLSSSNNWINVANRLGEIMGHTDANGVSRSNVVPGLQSYISEKGYSSNFSVSRDTTPSFGELDFEVEKYHPAMLSVNDYMTSVGGHNITLVGTESYYQVGDGVIGWVYHVIVHDNWETTPEKVWFEYGDEDLDDIYKINEVFN